MEGLHHDTDLDSTAKTPNGGFNASENKQEKEAEEVVPSPKSTSNFLDSAINQSLSSQEKIGLYDQMVRIRRFEERSLRAYQQGNIGGFLHLYIGQEAVAVGSVSVLGKDDHVITAYRDHGHAIAVGMHMDECMAELYGEKTG